MAIPNVLATISQLVILLQVAIPFDPTLLTKPNGLYIGVLLSMLTFVGILIKTFLRAMNTNDERHVQAEIKRNDATAAAFEKTTQALIQVHKIQGEISARLDEHIDQNVEDFKEVKNNIHKTNERIDRIVDSH